MLRIAVVVCLAGAAGWIGEACADSIVLEFSEVELAQNTLLDGTTYYNSYGVTFSGGTIYRTSNRFLDAGADTSGITTNALSGVHNPFTVSFTDPVSRATFDWSLLGGANDINAYAYSPTGDLIGTFSSSGASGQYTFDGIGQIGSITWSDSGQQVGIGRLEFSRDFDVGSAFLFLPTSGLSLPGADGEYSGSLFLSFLGSLNGSFPGNGIDFADSYDFEGVFLQNGMEFGTFWGLDAVGFSPHTYSGDPIPVDADVQVAIEAGMEAIRNQDPLYLGLFPELMGFNEPGELAIITPDRLVEFFAQFNPNDPLDPAFLTFQQRLTEFLFAVDYSTIDFSDDNLSAGGEDILFPHFPFDVSVQFSALWSLNGDGTISGFTGSTQVIPEPGSIALVVVGLAGAVALRRRRRAV